MTQDQRREERLPIESVILPFLGSHGDGYQPFQYILQDINSRGVRVALPQWVVSRTLLRAGETVHFHLPFLLGDRVLDSGDVAWERWDEEDDIQYVGAEFSHAAPVHHPVYLKVSSSQVTIDLRHFSGTEALFGRVLKDSLMLKRGILIYLKHLRAYFSRVGGMRGEDWEFFRDNILDDVRARVQANAQSLDNWCEQCQSCAVSMLDLEELRQAMEPELYLDLFRSAMGEDTARLYLKAIKELEKRLFANHNTLVMLYIKSL